MTINIRSYSNNLYLGENGIWFSREKKEVFYPEIGNDFCLGIEDSSFWFRHRNDCLLSLLQWFPPSMPLFDVGGGNGFVTDGLVKHGIETVLVEPGNSGAKNAKKRGIANVVCSTVEDAGFFPGSLPSIGIFDVIEHIQKDEEFLKTLSGLLPSKGRLYIATPAFQLLWSSEDVFAQHFRRYSVPDLIRKLQKAGFVIEFSTYFFSFLVAPIFLLRTIPSFLGFRKAENQQTAKSEHQPTNTSRFILDVLRLLELSFLKKKKRIPFGASCMVVARKK